TEDTEDKKEEDDHEIMDEKEKAKEIYGDKINEVLESGELYETKYNNFVATQIPSEREPEEGMKNIAIEFRFENKESHYYYNLFIHHSLILLTPSGDRFNNVDVTILDSDNWERERQIDGV